jgi:hypothetical protein
MATEHVQPDDADDAQLSWLLSSAHAAPAMRHEFVSSLTERLDAEFAARRRAGMNGAAAPSRNGAPKPVGWVEPSETHHEAHDQTVGLADGHRRGAVVDCATVPVDPPHQASKLRRRRAVMMATAASLLVAAAVFSDPPAWAAALRALVHRIGEFTIGGAPEQAAQSNRVGAQPNAPVTADAPTVVQPATTATNRSIEAEVVQNLIARKDPIPDVPAAESVPPQPVANLPLWEPYPEPLAPEELSQRVDDELAAVWQANAIRPVGPATDAEFMRRVYLDLTGRIPSVSEVQEFLEDPAPDRREALVDRLLAHHDHATHLAAVWRGILLPAEADLSRLGGTAKFDQWLAERFEQNLRYDELVRDLLLAEGRVAESGPLLFYAALKLNPEELAGRTSRAFLGVRMECAQCHDHKFDDITQHDFWSFAAFFARISRPRGKMEMTSPVLAVRDNQQGDVMIPETDEVVAPRLPLTAVEIVDTPDGPTRREVLVDWLTSPNNGHFARATVNRVWAHLFGRGLVEPVDDMRVENASIAPEVLETLSRDFAASEFDLRRLLRALVLTQTYQLSSRSDDSDPARTLHFAQMNIKSLTAEQLYDCIEVATRQSSSEPGGPPLRPGLERFADTSRQAFIEQFRAPAGQATDYHAGIPQALTLMHGGLIHNATDVTTSGLLTAISASFFTDDQRLDTLFLSTLSRYPTDEEREFMLEPVEAASSDTERQQALGDVLWALLNSAEFTLNH